MIKYVLINLKAKIKRYIESLEEKLPNKGYKKKTAKRNK